MGFGEKVSIYCGYWPFAGIFYFGGGGGWGGGKGCVCGAGGGGGGGGREGNPKLTIFWVYQNSRYIFGVLSEYGLEPSNEQIVIFLLVLTALFLLCISSMPLK